MHHYKPPWVLVELHYANYMVVTCFVIVLAAIFVYIRRLHPWQRQIPRVPTMSYFMTEEGQAEEGLHVAEFENKYFSGQHSWPRVTNEFMEVLSHGFQLGSQYASVFYIYSDLDTSILFIITELDMRVSRNASFLDVFIFLCLTVSVQL